MSTYYEMLKVLPSASAAEIQAAVDAQYNQWRQLVAHHLPEVTEQANQSLRILETIRATLTDPAKRAGYDAGIGIGGVAGGLADPEAILRGADPAQVLPPPASRSTAHVSGPGLWTCPNPDCKADNPAQTRFCFKCRTELVRECPECGKMSSLVMTGNCGECGYSYDLAVQRHAAKERCDKLQMDIQKIQAEIARLTPRTSWGRVIGYTALVAVCAPLVGFLFALTAIGYAFGETFWGVTVLITLLAGVFLLLIRHEGLREIVELRASLTASSEQLKIATNEWETLALRK